MPALLLLFGFLLMASLPVTFFRRGRLNARWWLTAAPFAVAFVALVGDLVAGRPGARALTDAAALVAACTAIGLILAARAAHRAPVALWHQGAVPDELVAVGPYARIRHPFYASFLLLLAGAAIATPHLATLIALAWGVVAISVTARDEERTLLSSPLGPLYRDYVARTGRFVPRLRRTP